MAAFPSPSRASIAVLLVLCMGTNALSPSAKPAKPIAAPAKPAKPIAAQVMDAVVGSELWRRIMVPQAKKTMRDTAKANGVDWSDALDYIKNAATWDDDARADDIGDYYFRPFHAYDDGNCCLEAAWEQEIASKAVGARNYPEFGAKGDDAFRDAFDAALDELGAAVPAGGVVYDIGCGTGTSTRRLAARYPEAADIVGVDASPQMIQVARELVSLSARGALDARWVNEVAADERVSFERASAEAFLPNKSADVVVLSLVVHELPPFAYERIVQLCHDALKPDGQLWIYDMDFDTPGFADLRANPLLFSLIRSTEPYLDEYADYGVARMAAAAANVGFSEVRLRAATGRHFALVAEKAATGAGVVDRRLETRLPDTHLASWAVKS